MRTAIVLAVTVAAVLAGPAWAAFPGRNGSIVYSECFCPNSNGFEDGLVSILANGRASRLRYKGDRGGDDPAFSPRGRLLDVGPHGGRIFLESSRGGRGRQLTFAPDSAPAWSPRSGEFVFSRALASGNTTLRIYHANHSRALTDGDFAAWSVKGLIAFQGADGIYVIRPSGAGLHRIIAGGTRPNWSPDGRRLVFVTPDGHIATARADGSEERRLTHHLKGSEAVFSPNGRWVAFGGSDALYVLRLRDRHVRTIVTETDPDYSINSFDWQPLR